MNVQSSRDDALPLPVSDRWVGECLAHLRSLVPEWPAERFDEAEQDFRWTPMWGDFAPASAAEAYRRFGASPLEAKTVMAAEAMNLALSDGVWIDRCVTRLALRWPLRRPDQLARIGSELAGTIECRRQLPESAADTYVWHFEAQHVLEPSAFELSVRLGTGKSDVPSIDTQIGLAAASAAFRAASVTPAAAAQGEFARRSYDEFGCPDEMMPSEEQLAAAEAWDEATGAARVALSHSVGIELAATAELELNWRHGREDDAEIGRWLHSLALGR